MQHLFLYFAIHLELLGKYSLFLLQSHYLYVIINTCEMEIRAFWRASITILEV